MIVRVCCPHREIAMEWTHGYAMQNIGTSAMHRGDEMVQDIGTSALQRRDDKQQHQWQIWSTLSTVGFRHGVTCTSPSNPPPSITWVYHTVHLTSHGRPTGYHHKRQRKYQHSLTRNTPCTNNWPKKLAPADNRKQKTHHRTVQYMQAINHRTTCEWKCTQRPPARGGSQLENKSPRTYTRPRWRWARSVAS